MKRICFAFLVLLTSCGSKVFPLKGTYPSTPITFTSEKSFDQVWDKLIDLFAQKGLSIKIIDRSSGLIISDGAMPVTIEDKTGTMKNPQAYVAVAQMKGYFGYEPISGTTIIREHGKNVAVWNDIIGEWNVRIKTAGTGTSINVNIVNTRTKAHSAGNTVIQSTSIDVKSTGYFEKLIADQIK